MIILNSDQEQLSRVFFNLIKNSIESIHQKSEDNKDFKKKVSIEINKPLFLHERDAHSKFVEVTSTYLKDMPKSIVHCFTGDLEALTKYLDMGFYIGITGWLCDERRGKHLEELVPLIPLEKLMIETDAPYLLPRDMGIDNSSRNEPKYLQHIAKKVASLRKESDELVYSSIYMNSLDFFDISV